MKNTTKTTKTTTMTKTKTVKPMTKTNSTQAKKIFSLKKVEVNSKGYDSTGVYHGTKTSTVWRYARGQDSIFGFVFASTREQAKIKVRNEMKKLHRLQPTEVHFYK